MRRWLLIAVLGGLTLIGALAWRGGGVEEQESVGKIVVSAGPPPAGFEEQRYAGWVFGRMMGIKPSDFPRPGQSAMQPGVERLIQGGQQGKVLP